MFACTFALVPASIIFIHYHKTGHDAVGLISREVAKVLRVKPSVVGQRRRCDSTMRPLSCNSSIVIWTAPTLACLPPGVLPSCFDVLHFVRDPATWAISAYDYHRQVPTPERGLVDRVRPMCLEPPAYYHLGHDHSSRAVHACRNLFDANHSLYNHLLTLPEYDGVKMMALRNILSESGGTEDAGGDLMRMVTNALMLRQDPARHIHNVWMDELKARPEAVLSGVLDFAGARSSSLLDALLSQQMKLMSTSKHVTNRPANMANATRRVPELIRELEADRDIAPIHTIARSVFTWGWNHQTHVLRSDLGGGGTGQNRTEQT
jgi:hypothetical protein